MSDIVQFILVRTDMESMSRGRIAAQCVHAGNQMVCHINGLQRDKISSGEVMKYALYLQEWEAQTGYGFGTCYVMDVDEEKLSNVIEEANSKGFLSGTVRDPTYPVKDGEVIHLVSVITCGYIFGKKDDIKKLLIKHEIDFLK